MQQKRLIIALLISTAILFLWSYLVPQPQQPKPPQTPSTTATPQQTASPAPSSNPSPSPVPQAQSANATPHRVVLIRTPPYEAPLQLAIGDAAVDGVLTSTNYAIEGIDSGTGDSELTLQAGEKKRITFLLKDQVTGLDVAKTMVLDADSYIADLEVTIKRGNNIVPQAKIRVGPSIGDQGVKYYSFYSVAPETVAAVGDKVERHTAQAINENKGSPDHLSIPGPVDWAGVGDTYFAMVAIPGKKLEGLELRTTQYDYSA